MRYEVTGSLRRKKKERKRGKVHTIDFRSSSTHQNTVVTGFFSAWSKKLFFEYSYHKTPVHKELKTIELFVFCICVLSLYLFCLCVLFVGNTNTEGSVTLTNMIIINISNVDSPYRLFFRIRAAFNINKRQLFILFHLPSFSLCRHELYIKLFQPLTIFITPLNGRKDNGNHFS